MNKKLVCLIVWVIIIVILATAYHFLWRSDLIITNVQIVDPLRCIYNYEVKNVGFVSVKNFYIATNIDFCSLVGETENCKYWGVVGHNPENGDSPSVTLSPGQTIKTTIYLRTYKNKCPDKFDICVDCGTRINWEKIVQINDIKEIRENNNIYKFNLN